MDPIQRQHQGRFDRWGDRKIEEAMNRQLEHLGLSINADGTFDAETVEALKQLQFHHGLPVTGKIDAHTTKLLEIEVSDDGLIIADNHGTGPLSESGRPDPSPMVESALAQSSFENGTVKEGTLEKTSTRVEVAALKAVVADGPARHALSLMQAEASLNLDSGSGLGAEAALLNTKSTFETKFADIQIETRGAGATAKAGFRNPDGSYGSRADLSATAASIKATVAFGPSKENQITLGGGVGVGASGHFGVRDIDDDGYTEYCAAVGARLVDVGACRESLVQVHDDDGDGRLEFRSQFHDGVVELPYVASPSQQFAVKLFNQIEQALIQKSKAQD